MSARSIAILVVLSLLALFAIVNWSAFIAPTHLSLLFTSFDAPLGLVMLGCTAVLVAIVFSYMLKHQVLAFSESRKQSEELRRQRELADQAEASRFTELRKYLEQEMASLRQAQQASLMQLREELTTSTNTLAACIGEIDERLDRQLPLSPEQQP